MSVTLWCPCGNLRATFTPRVSLRQATEIAIRYAPVYCPKCGNTVRPVPESTELQEAS